MKRLYYQVIDKATSEIVLTSKTRMVEDDVYEAYPLDKSIYRMIGSKMSVKGRRFHLEPLSRDEYLEETDSCGFDIFYNKTDWIKLYEGSIHSMPSAKELQYLVYKLIAPSTRGFLSKFVKDHGLKVSDLYVKPYTSKLKDLEDIEEDYFENIRKPPVAAAYKSPRFLLW